MFENTFSYFMKVTSLMIVLENDKLLPYISLSNKFKTSPSDVTFVESLPLYTYFLISKKEQVFQLGYLWGKVSVGTYLFSYFTL